MRFWTVAGVRRCALPIPARQFRAARRQPARQRAFRQVQLVGGLLPRPALQMTEKNRQAKLLRQAAQFAVEDRPPRSEEHTAELQSQSNLVCRLLLSKKKK